ncbi:hypothetical protein [Nocardia sp. NPDC024068]|uniref:hypothetical protein n=1 Tax=Nocardia sp. NPDC024068 TaxID=3157197 RepID=UPI0033E6BCD5
MMVTVVMRDDIQFKGMLLINFRDYEFGESGARCRRWIDVKSFSIPQISASDDRLIAKLIEQEQFRDDYVGGGVDPKGTHHGPYRIECVSSDSYMHVESGYALDLITDWIDGCGVVPESLMLDVESNVLLRMRAATAIFELRDLGDSAVGDYGFIHGEFHELVVIDRNAGSLHLIIAADD